MSKNWANDLIQNGTLKLPVKFELHLTGILSQRDKVPLTRKMLKRTIHKDHINLFRAVIRIPSMKVLSDTLELDIDFGIQYGLSLLKDLYPATPRQELRITGDIRH